MVFLFIKEDILRMVRGITTMERFGMDVLTDHWPGVDGKNRIFGDTRILALMALSAAVETWFESGEIHNADNDDPRVVVTFCVGVMFQGDDDPQNPAPEIVDVVFETFEDYLHQDRLHLDGSEDTLAAIALWAQAAVESILVSWHQALEVEVCAREHAASVLLAAPGFESEDQRELIACRVKDPLDSLRRLSARVWAVYENLSAEADQ